MTHWIDSLPDNPDTIANVLPARLNEIERGKEYMHKEWGRVMVISSHPHDGACLIIERMETTDPDCDDLTLDTCESSDLTETQGSNWPFLGFTK